MREIKYYHSLRGSSSWTLIKIALLLIQSLNLSADVDAFNVVSTTSTLPHSHSFLRASTSTLQEEETQTQMEILMKESIARAEKEHERQYEYGSEIFGSSGRGAVGINNSQRQWADDHFKSYSVGVGNGGPSETLLENGNLLFETLEPVLSEEECAYFRDSARLTIAKEKQMDAEQASLTNSDLGEVRLSNLPKETLEKIKTLLSDKLYPMLSERFGVHDLAVYDGLVLGTIAPSMSQPVHRDASLLTLNIPLSSPQDFVGGGTYVEGLLESDDDSKDRHNGLPLRMEKGKALCHSSGIMHAGTSITEGERWVMVMFVIAKDEPQIARRVHAEGLDAIDANALDFARGAFEAGLKYAPKDHLLHMGIGQVASMVGNDEEALKCLTQAAKYYPPSYKAAVTAGKILLSRRKPRAALRRFEQVLSHLNDRDLVDGAWMPLKAMAWDVRVSAVRCTLMCAEYESAKHSFTKRPWSKQMLPLAIERLHKALIPAPGNEALEEMLQRCEELLSEA